MDIKRQQWSAFEHLKFSPTGAIKPFYGMTCITWVDPQSKLFEILSTTQRNIQASFEQTEAAQYFCFLDPASFHMTICDITANPTPTTEKDASNISSQVQDAFSQGFETGAISAQVRGVGFKSTISALVRFEDVKELQKVFHLEKVIKSATQVDRRDFAGHITLAYCVNPKENRLDEVWSILKPFQEFLFGDFTFSEFDLTCFTDMNTFIPLTTFNLETEQITDHFNLDQCMCC